MAVLLVIPVVLAALPFWVLTVLAAAINRAILRHRRKADPWQSIIEYAPVVGWRNRSNLAGRALIQGGSFGFVTDRDGWRGGLSMAEADIVVFGDSFAFGHGAEEGDFFASLPSDVTIKGIGANGYNTVQAIQWMQRLVPSLPGRFVGLFVYYGNDLVENLLPCSLNGYRTPFVRPRMDTGEWEITTDHVRLEHWPFSVRPQGSQLPTLCCDVPSSRRAYSALDYLVGLAADLCSAVGATLLVIGVPDPRQLRTSDRESLAAMAPDRDSFDADRPDHELRAICDRVGLRFLPLSEHLTPPDYLVVDCHWTPRGHRRVAEALVREYRSARAASEERPEQVEPALVQIPSPAGGSTSADAVPSGGGEAR